MATLIEKIASTLTKRQADRTDDFRALVRDIAGGREPKPDKVEEILTATGRTLDDLRGAVATHEQRTTWAAVNAQVPALDAERVKINDRLAAEGAKLQAAEDAHEAATAPLVRRLDEIARADRDAMNARERLVAECPYPELVETLATTRRKLAALRSERVDVGRHYSDAFNGALNLEERRKFWDKHDAERHAEFAAGRDRYSKRIADIDAEIVTLEAEEKTLAERMLQP